MEYKDLPLHTPLVVLATFAEWEREFSKEGILIPNYRTTFDRLFFLNGKIEGDPIAYIIDLSKKKNLNDAEVAEALSIIVGKENKWTPKMVFTLRKQCGIRGNDYRNEAIEVAKNVYRQPTHIQDLVAKYTQAIDRIVPDITVQQLRNQEERLARIMMSFGFTSLDTLLEELIGLNMGERPIKQILDLLYTKHSIPEGKGNRVGHVYIRNKIRALKLVL